MNSGLQGWPSELSRVFWCITGPSAILLFILHSSVKLQVFQGRHFLLCCYSHLGPSSWFLVSRSNSRSPPGGSGRRVTKHLVLASRLSPYATSVAPQEEWLHVCANMNLPSRGTSSWCERTLSISRSFRPKLPCWEVWEANRPAATG